MKIMTSFSIILSLLLVVSAHAAMDPAACKTDAQKYCPGIKPGDGAIEACFKENEKSLSPACMQYRQETKKKVGDFIKDCGGDIKKICAGVQPGEGRIIACLKNNQTTLSPECKNRMKTPTK